MSCPFRVGFGYDIHQLVEGRALVLGGVTIPHDKGLLGHSDADVLTHAVSDAILGAIGERDIGNFFPDTDPVNKDMNSQLILRRAVDTMRQAGWELGNIDVTLIAQEPRMAPHVSMMQERLSITAGVKPGQIGIKATTNEKLDSVGQGQGIAAHAVALVYRPE